VSTGAIAANAHEGSRSEYLAQYVFAGFGTAVSVPHQEDAGIDLYCTITERIGQRAWPRAYFTVQVKSTDDPWVFDGENSVRWLLEHPTPLFLCVVDKANARLRVYQTSPRLLSGVHLPLPKRVVLQPEETTTGRMPDWISSEHYSLSAPILDFTVIDLGNDDRAAMARTCLLAWATIDSENIRCRANGIAAVSLPHSYVTNEIPVNKSTVTLSGQPHEAAIPRLIEALEHIGLDMARNAMRDRKNAELTTAALLNMLHRQLTRAEQDRPRCISFLNEMLNDRMEAKRNYLFDGVDRLIEGVRCDVKAIDK